MSFFMFPSFFFFLFCPCGPHLWSRNGGRERRRKERNANFNTTVTECRRGDWERENVTRLRKWDGHCTLCAHVSACVSTERSGWQSDWHSCVFSPFFVFFLPCSPANEMIYIHMHSPTYICLCAGGKWTWTFYVSCLNIFFVHPIIEFLPLMFSCRFSFLSFIPVLSLFSPLTCVENIIPFNGWTGVKIGSLVGGKVGGKWVSANVGKSEEKRKRLLYLYPITTPASPKVTFAEKACTHSLKIATSIPPPPCACMCVSVTVVMR